MMRRAYSLLNVKTVTEHDDYWLIEGIASTPSVDRMEDVVDPMGAKFVLPMPLLWQHNSEKPVGNVTFAQPKKDGIPYKARLPKVKEDGVLKQRIDEAVQSIKYRLVMAVSIGFRVLENGIESLKSGGLLIKNWEWLELSLVTIPANPDATISGIKSFDDQVRAALGRNGPESRNRPGASGHTTGAAAAALSHSRSLKGNIMQTLKDLREARATKAARLTELVEARKAENRHFTDEEGAEFDGLSAEVAELDDEIRVKSFEALNARAATPVDTKRFNGTGGGSGPTILVKKQDPDDKFKGQALTRLFIAKAAAFMSMKDGLFLTPAQVAEQRWGKSHPKLVQYIKAAVAGGGTGSGEWGAELAQSDTRYTGDFVDFLYSMTVFDRLPLREVPSRVHIKGQDGAATGFWVGESKAINVSKPDFSSVELTPLKVGAIAVCSKELITDSSPAAEMWIRDSLAQASAQRVDTTFLSATGASNGVSPAGLLSGLVAGSASGADADALRADIQALYAGFIAAKNASGLMMVMQPSLAKAISLMTNALGQTEFPGLNASGGTLLGDQVLTGDNVGPGDMILLKPSDIWKIGDSGLEVSMTDTATLEQDNAPQGATDQPTAASATLVNLWQSESIGFKVVRRINYAKRRTSAVAFIGNANYGVGAGLSTE